LLRPRDEKTVTDLEFPSAAEHQHAIGDAVAVLDSGNPPRPAGNEQWRTKPKELGEEFIIALRHLRTTP
jgi:hypothetical protein